MKQRIGKFPNFTYMAINKTGDLHTNTNGSKPNAVTWGVFPGREVVQPTIVELSSFDAWKDEAFALWEQWSRCHGQNTKPRVLLGEMGETWYLVNIVNNDYHEKDGIYELFKDDVLALQKLQAAAAASSDSDDANDRTGADSTVDVLANKLKDIGVNGAAEKVHAPLHQESAVLTPNVEAAAIALPLGV